MEPKSRPLWQLLLTINDPAARTHLTCDESFLVLEYLAEQAVSGPDPQAVLNAAKRQMALLPHCREHHIRRLKELEEKIGQRHLPFCSVETTPHKGTRRRELHNPYRYGKPDPAPG